MASIGKFVSDTVASTIKSAVAGLVPTVTALQDYTAVGNGQVVKMEYYIMIGPFDNEPDTLLAWTESFRDGISLSEIKWGYVNTSNAADSGLGQIEFTLHDIAGKSLANFIRVRKGTNYIHFKGPMSSGKLCPIPAWSMYFPIPEDCKIEFNATQGFTYTFVGKPIVQLGKSNTISATSDFTITGSQVEKETTFEDYLNKVVMPMWNTQIEESNHSEKVSPKIKNFEFVSDDKLSYEDNPAQVTLKEVKSAQSHLEPFAVTRGMNIDTLVTSLFNERFKKEEDYPKRPIIEVNFKRWQGEGHTLQVRFVDNTVEDVVSDMIVCIGDDKNCAGFDFRGQLVGISFNELITQFASIADGDISPSGDLTQGGNVKPNPADTSPVKVDQGNEKAVKRDTSAYSSLPMGHGSTAMWGQLTTYLQQHNIPGLTLDIELPFSFGFTPMSLGGLLKDSIEGGTGVGIHYTQGCELKFFWYEDPDCAKLVLRPEISQSYRITSVTHTIGLNGNTTQVGLSHLHIGK